MLPSAGVPTILVEAGFRFFFFSNERFEPPHVHVARGDGLAKFWLEPVELVESYGMKRQELRQARLLVEAHQETFRERWREYFSS